MTLRIVRPLAVALLACTWALAARAADPPKPPKITFEEHVRPIFREHCATCHNQNKATNDLALDVYDRVLKGGASGDAIKPGDLDNSYLWLLVNHKSEPHMPPKADKLPAPKLEIIRQWILGGALKDAGATATAPKPAAMSLSSSAGAAKPDGPVVLPQGLSRQPVLYTPRPGAVTALAASPWAPLVAVAGQKQIALYHSDNGQLLGILPFPEGIAYVLRFSRSGELLLAGGGQNVRRGRVVVYNVKTGIRLFEVGDELDVVLAADISADGRRIALGGPEKIVRVFSTADGKQAFEIRKHTDWVYAAEFSPDGVLLATADRSGGLLVWEAETGREFHNLEGHKAAVTSLSFRDDSNMLASGSEDGSIKLWEMEEGKPVKSINAHAGGVAHLAFAHDGRIVSGGRDRVVKLWDASGNPIRALEPMPEQVMKVAFAYDGARVLAGDFAGELRLSSAADGKLAASLASNPPTLAMRAEAAAAQAAAAQAAADKLAKELAELNARLEAARRAAQQATAMAAQKAEAGKTALTQAEQAKAAAAAAVSRAEQAAKDATAQKAEAEKHSAAVAPLEKALAEKAALAKAATEAAAAAKTAAEQSATEKAAAEKKPAA